MAKKEKSLNEELEQISSEDVEELEDENQELDQFEDASEDEEDIDPEEVFKACDDLLNAKFFDVEFFKTLFMETRKMIDEAYKNRTKSKQAEDDWDNMVYNLTSKATDEPIFQDFLGYAYKKGTYDFCLMNFEKYLKWTILAGANGNGFSLSKLQLFFNSQIEYILSQEGQQYIIDLLMLSFDEYVLFLTKKLCMNIVEDLNLTPVELFKEDEVYVEQNDRLMRQFELIKEKAKDKLVKECENLYQKMLKVDEINEELAVEDNSFEEQEPEAKEVDVEAEAMKNLDSGNKFVKKKTSKKQFRW